MKNKITIIALSLVALMAAGCKREASGFETFEGFALGTTYSVTVKGTPEQLEGVPEIIEKVVELANNTYSIYNENSLLSRLNNNETTETDPNITYLLNVAAVAHGLSGGMYDVTILPLKEAYGFQQGVPAQENPDIDSLLQYVGFGKLSAKDGQLVKENPNVRIDLNSVAKGYTVDFIANSLDQADFTDYLVDIGGETVCRGTNSKGELWRIGVERPEEGNYVKGSSIQTIIALSGKGMATSGNYRNFHTDGQGRKYTHIINPLTGENTESRLLSATVIDSKCAVADALATMFISLGLEESLKVVETHPEFAVLFIYADDEGGMKTMWSDAMKPYIVE